MTNQYSIGITNKYSIIILIFLFYYFFLWDMIKFTTKKLLETIIRLIRLDIRFLILQIIISLMYFQ